MTSDCPHCGQSLECDQDMAGEVVDCPACQRDLTIPSAQLDEGWCRVTSFKAHYYRIERTPPDWVTPKALCGREDFSFDMFLMWLCHSPPPMGDRCKTCQKKYEDLETPAG